MTSNKILLTLFLSGATALGTAQMMPNPGQNPTMPGQQQPMPGQPGRPGTMGGEIPDNVGTQTTGQNPTTNAPAVPKVPDATLERDVKQQLSADPALAGVQVSAHNGKVELTGSVISKEDRKKAKEMAKSVPGVTSVKEHISLGAPTTGGAASATPSSNPGQNTAGSMSGNTSVTGNGNSSTPDTPPQQTPQSNTQPNPPSPDTPPHASVTTPAGSGARLVNASYQEAPSTAQNSKATTGSDAASGSANVAALTPAPLGSSDDNAALQSRIENALHNEPSLRDSHVTVSVTDSTIDLNGTASSVRSKVAAERIAQSFGANRKLNDKLTVSGGAPATAAR